MKYIAIMKYFRVARLLCPILLVLPGLLSAQQNAKSVLREKIQKAIAASGADVGVGVTGLDFRDSFTYNGKKHFPMQSVFKFPLALTVLHKIDKRELSPDQQILVPKGSLNTHTWSPMVKDFPKGNFKISIAQLLGYTVSKSDNNACDILFKLAGGTKAVDKYIHGLGVEDIAITATEAEMRKSWKVQYTNWCAPIAMVRLLELFYNGEVLSKANSELMMKLMTESENSPNRIKGKLPKDALVAHKTGTSDINDQGMAAATNDIGIVTLPDGRHFAIVVYVSDFKGGIEKGDALIAEIAHAMWNYYTVK